MRRIMLCAVNALYGWSLWLLCVLAVMVAFYQNSPAFFYLGALLFLGACVVEYRYGDRV